MRSEQEIKEKLNQLNKKYDDPKIIADFALRRLYLKIEMLEWVLDEKK